jgi:hypothetical protein
MSCAEDNVYDIIADQGATFLRSFAVKNRARQPIPLTGYTAKMQVLASETDDTIILNLTAGNGRIEVLASAAIVNITVSAADMAAVAAGDYIYSLEAVNNSTLDTTVLAQGNFKVRAEVTS